METNCKHTITYQVQKSNNLVERCINCDKFIRNAPHDKPRIYFGKYKGKAIDEFNTPEMMSYLYWMKNNPEVWAKLSRNVQTAITNRMG
jgi:hypothetical protein